MISGDLAAAAVALKDLTTEYYRLYKADINSSVHRVSETGEPEIYEMCVYAEGERGIVKACLQVNAYQIEDVNAAKCLIPKLHQEFMRVVFKRIKEFTW